MELELIGVESSSVASATAREAVVTHAVDSIGQLIHEWYEYSGSLTSQCVYP